MADKFSSDGSRQDISVLLAGLLDTAPSSITVFDVDTGDFLYANEKTFSLYGYTQEEFMRMKLSDLDSLRDQELFKPRIKEVLERGGASFEVEHRRKDGALIPILVHARSARWADKNVVLSVSSDISELKSVQNALRKLNQLFEYTQKISKVGGWEYDVVNRKSTWTEEVYRIYGVDHSYDPSDIGADMRFYAPESLPLLREAFTNALERGQEYDLELEFIRADGRKIWVRTMGHPVMENGKAVRIVGNFMDINERKTMEMELRQAYEKLQKAQEELIQSAKMASLGEMVAGISHELNQPLTGIKGFAQFALADDSSLEVCRECLEKIEDQSNRMDVIIKNLRIFARHSSSETAAVDINRAIRSSLALMEHEFTLEGITLEKKFDPGLPQVQGDNNQLQQVFINLISNARDAIVSCRDGRPGRLEIKAFRSKDGKEICARFSDNGCGISPELTRKIFDPFFTTKGPDRGMGLGLAICYRIVENHRGRIQVESKEGIGSVFTVCFPYPESVL